MAPWLADSGRERVRERESSPACTTCKYTRRGWALAGVCRRSGKNNGNYLAAEDPFCVWCRARRDESGMLEHSQPRLCLRRASWENSTVRLLRPYILLVSLCLQLGCARSVCPLDTALFCKSCCAEPFANYNYEENGNVEVQCAQLFPLF